LAAVHRPENVCHPANRAVDAPGVDPVEALRRCGGMASRARLLDVGVSRRSLERAVRDNRVVRHPRGYTLAGAPAELVAAARWGAGVGCVSALGLHGIPLVTRPATVHLLLPSWRVTDAVAHRSPFTGPVEPLVSATARALRCLARHEALAAVDAVLRTGVELDDLTRAVGPRPGPATRWMLTHADARAESPLESMLRAVLVDAGVRRIEPQVGLPGVGRVDLLVDGWLVIEADGFAHHSGRAEYRLDRRRLAAQARLGLVTLRFSWEDVLGQPGGVVTTVRTVLARRRRHAFRLAAGQPVRHRQPTVVPPPFGSEGRHPLSLPDTRHGTAAGGRIGR